MAVNLKKNESINLSKEAPKINKMLLGLGWHERETNGDSFDLDVSVFLLNAMGRVSSDKDFIFYNNLTSQEGAITHIGDNRTGHSQSLDHSDGLNQDNEQIVVLFDKVPSYVERIVVCVSIHDAEQKKQNFGMVSSAYIRCVEYNSQKEIACYDLSEEASTETGMIFGELILIDTKWIFKAVGQSVAGGLAALAKNFGVNV